MSTWTDRLLPLSDGLTTGPVPGRSRGALQPIPSRRPRRAGGLCCRRESEGERAPSVCGMLADRSYIIGTTGRVSREEIFFFHCRPAAVLISLF